MAKIYKFKNSTSGNFGALLAVTLVPLLGAVGLSVDFSAISNTKSKLQNAVDAGALFAGKHIQKTGKDPKLADIKKFVRANYSGTVSNVTFKRVGKEAFVSADARAPSFFFGNMMPDAFDVSADAGVPLNTTPPYLEIALVLDNTGSMSADNKMVDLKRVANDFITDFETDPDRAAKTRIGVVPFANHVNVGLHNRNASWMDVPPDETSTVNECRMVDDYVSSNCRLETVFQDGVSSQQNVCDWTVTGQTEVCQDWTNSNVWQGCVGSRFAPYTLTDSHPNVRFKGLLNVWCSEPITPLTGNFAAARAAIDKMVPSNDTYMAPGVMWGMRLLSSQPPFQEGKEFGTVPGEHRKVLILMSDGDNSRSANLPWDESNWGTDVAQADDWTLKACTAAKDAGITVYSISFGSDLSASGKNVIKNCANDPSDYYHAANATRLEEAFEDIATKVTNLRLTN